MSRIGISITKETAFRDNQQEFSNVYYYNNDPGSLPDAAGAEALIDGLVALEKTWHSSVVSFIHARLWSAGGGPAENNMIFEKSLSGAGSGATSTTLDKERAILIQYEAGFDSRGHRVMLRKWYHICGAFPGATGATGTSQQANTIAIPTADRSVISNTVDDILVRPEAGGNWTLCAKSGRARTSSNPGCHKYLEHHQLGNQWRG